MHMMTRSQARRAALEPASRAKSLVYRKVLRGQIATEHRAKKRARKAAPTAAAQEPTMLVARDDVEYARKAAAQAESAAVDRGHQLAN